MSTMSVLYALTERMAVPAVPSSLLEPIWAEFAALLPERGEFHPDHPLGCHRRRIPDRVVFEHLVEALVHGSGYERIASSACPDATIRRRLKQWAAAGIAEQVHAMALAAHHRVIGLLLADIGADGCITKAPCGGDTTGPSPVDRRKGGLKRSVATDGGGCCWASSRPGLTATTRPCWAPQHAAPTQVGADWPAQLTVHLDAGYDSTITAPCSTGWACTARSPAKASPPRSRSANDGSSSARMVG